MAARDTIPVSDTWWTSSSSASKASGEFTISLPAAFPFNETFPLFFRAFYDLNDVVGGSALCQTLKMQNFLLEKKLSRKDSSK